MANKNIIFLAGKGPSTDIIYNSLSERYNILKVIIEEEEDTKAFLKRRIKKLGVLTVMGQVLFQIFVVKPLQKISKLRREEIIRKNSLNIAPIHTQVEKEKLIRVKSVNGNEVIETLQKMRPDLIVINGTRIISKKILSCVGCKFINIHAGITPKYRGVHGAYWALVNNDSKHCGVTVHFVDAGVDTGGVILQENITPTKYDNFTTYPVLQLAQGIKLLNMSIDAYFKNSIILQNPGIESHLWYHPTIWEYFYYRIKKGIK